MSDPIEAILERDPRYRVDAYVFVHDALSHTVDKLRRRRHVTGRELLDGIRELAVERFGLMALSVLNSWGVRTTDDFGNIVFNLVGAGLMGKTEDDKVEDFHAVYDFDEVFVRDYNVNPDAG